MSFTDPPTTAIYPLPLHDALPILNPEADKTESAAVEHAAYEPDALARKGVIQRWSTRSSLTRRARMPQPHLGPKDRKSTRLNSSHANISYAVFCLKKKKHKRG